MDLMLVLAGIFVGVLSGFFGIGGGTVSVPILMYMGFDIKEAIGISVFQMLLSSIFGFFCTSDKVHMSHQRWYISDMAG